MGNQSIYRLAMLNSSDIVASLVPKSEGGGHLKQGLAGQFQEKYGDKVQLDFCRYPALRSDVLLQGLIGTAYPPELHQLAGNGESLDTQFKNPLLENRPDIVFLSLIPELSQTVWTHKEEGYLLQPPEGWNRTWSKEQQAWLQQCFEMAPQLTAEAFSNNFTKLIQCIREYGAQPVIYSVSTVVPGDNQARYFEIPEPTLALRIHQFNYELTLLAEEHGVSVIDVDLVVAELAADDHLVDTFHYSPTAYRQIQDEVFKVLETFQPAEEATLMPGPKLPAVNWDKLRGIRTKWKKRLRRRLNPRDKVDEIVVRNGSDNGYRIGLYGFGACHTRAFMRISSLIKPVMNGSCGIIYAANITSTRSDLILQTLEGIPDEDVVEVIERFKLPAWYFKPRLFEPTFRVNESEEFPKTIVGLSIAADLTRTLYRHRQHGYLVDPGGWWLNQSKTDVLNDLSKMTWFRQNFRSVGKLDVATFKSNLATIIELVKARTGAEVFVFNTPVVIPGGNRTYGNKMMPGQSAKRQRGFTLALLELAQEMDFIVVDLDRVAKQSGVTGLVDFAHWPEDKWAPVGKETFRLLNEMGLFSS